MCLSELWYWSPASDKFPPTHISVVERRSWLSEFHGIKGQNRLCALCWKSANKKEEKETGWLTTSYVFWVINKIRCSFSLEEEWVMLQREGTRVIQVEVPLHGKKTAVNRKKSFILHLKSRCSLTSMCITFKIIRKYKIINPILKASKSPMK